MLCAPERVEAGSPRLHCNYPGQTEWWLEDTERPHTLTDLPASVAGVLQWQVYNHIQFNPKLHACRTSSLPVRALAHGDKSLQMGEGAEKKQDNPAIGRMKLPFVMVVDWNSGDLKDNMDKPELRVMHSRTAEQASSQRSVGRSALSSGAALAIFKIALEKMRSPGRDFKQSHQRMCRCIWLCEEWG